MLFSQSATHYICDGNDSCHSCIVKIVTATAIVTTLVLLAAIVAITMYALCCCSEDYWQVVNMCHDGDKDETMNIMKLVTTLSKWDPPSSSSQAGSAALCLKFARVVLAT